MKVKGLRIVETYISTRTRFRFGKRNFSKIVKILVTILLKMTSFMSFMYFLFITPYYFKPNEKCNKLYHVDFNDFYMFFKNVLH